MSDNNIINTNGGTYISGDVQAKGDLIGRDQIIHGDIVYGNKYTLSKSQETLRHLLDDLNGWYNDIIERIHFQQIKFKERDSAQNLALTLGFDYVWRRDYLHKIIAIRRILMERSEMEPLVREIDNFLALLVEFRSDLQCADTLYSAT